MKRALALIILLLVCAVAFSDDFIHPLDFRGTEPEKKAVIAFIEKYVKDTYTKLGMGDPATLRMMEKEELEAFKKLTGAKNRKLLDEMIRTYSAIGMGTYSTIFMMYEEQLKASQESLSW